LMPMAGPIFPIYADMLRDAGREDLLKVSGLS
jgi:hypothetical protein